VNKNNLKIVHLTTAHLRYDTRIFVKMCSSLANQGYDVSLIVADGKGDEIKNGVKILDVGLLKNRFYRFFFSIFKVYRKAIKLNAKVYHFHDPELLLISCMLRLNSQADIIYDVHENVKEDILGKDWIPLFFRRFISVLFVLTERLMLKFINYIIVAEDSYLKIYKNRKNVTSILNYPIISLRKNKKNIRSNKVDSIINMVYVGGVSRIRGAVELIESVNLLVSSGHSNIFLKIIGLISLDFKNELFKLINKYKLNSHVAICGVISHETVYDEFEKAHIGLSILHPDPNFIESIPTKLYEYMSVGIPVIASDFPMWKKIIEKYQCGICVNPMNPKEIAEAIIYILNNPTKSMKMGTNGIAPVEDFYNWEKESLKLINIYDNIFQINNLSN
tara:strand:+ start:3463 stop:4632 length:1170 start_codon:yes stop_codon:yes gene_type:complete